MLIEFKKNYILDKTIHFFNKLIYHLVANVLMTPFTLNPTLKLRSALYFRYLIVILSFNAENIYIYIYVVFYMWGLVFF